MQIAFFAFIASATLVPSQGGSLFDTWYQNQIELNGSFSRYFQLNRLTAVIEGCLDSRVYESEAPEGQRSEAHRAYYTATSISELSRGIKDQAFTALDATTTRSSEDSDNFVRQFMTREAEQRATSRSLVEQMPDPIRIDYCLSALQEGGYQLGVGATPAWRQE